VPSSIQNFWVMTLCDDDSTLFRNVGKHQPRPKSSSTKTQKPQTSQL